MGGGETGKNHIQSNPFPSSLPLKVKGENEVKERDKSPCRSTMTKTRKRAVRLQITEKEDRGKICKP